MPIDPADIDVYLRAAAAAVVAEDWDAAERNVMAAQTLFAGVPDAGGASHNYEYRREQLDKLTLSIRRRSSAATGVQVNNVTLAHLTIDTPINVLGSF